MEPYRPAVDRAVARLYQTESKEDLALTPNIKRSIIETVTGRYLVAGEQRTLFDILTRTAQGLANAVLEGDAAWKPAAWEFVD